MLRIIFFTALVTVISSLLSNYLNYSSAKNQSIFFNDVNKEEFTFDNPDTGDNGFGYPSLAFNGVPIKTYISRYYTNSKKYFTAINLIKAGLEYNPFCTYSLYLLSTNYVYTNNFLEAEESLYTAYNLSPNIESIAALYFTILGELKKIDELKSVFEKVQSSDNKNMWKFYIGSLYSINSQSPSDIKFLEYVSNQSLKKFKANIIEN